MVRIKGGGGCNFDKNQGRRGVVIFIRIKGGKGL